MAVARGSTGSVRGLAATIVRDLFLDALEHLPAGEDFTRQELHDTLKMVAKEGDLVLSDDQAAALVHAFFRTVAPVAADQEHGVYHMPLHAEALVRHRLFRLPGGRYSVGDILQLTALLQEAEDRGITLTPTLADQLMRGSKALRALRLPAKGAARRV